MHLADGVLSAPVALSSAVAAVGLLALGIRRVEPEKVPRVGVLSALFFVASLIHVPMGVASAHLVLNGLLGMLLGWAVFPALAVALFLQAILFHFGGLVSLGANLVNMGVPGLLVYLAFGRGMREAQPARVFLLGACGGGLAVLGAGLAMCLSLWLSGREFAGAAAAVLAAHVPVAVTEGIVTGFVLSFLIRSAPHLLRAEGGNRKPEGGGRRAET